MSRQLGLLSLIVVAVIAAGCAAADQPGALGRGRSVYGDVCSVCHGPRGQGGAGPTLENVVETWPLCTDQVEWITFGSTGWQNRHGDTYGAPNKPVKGGMPGHGDTLTREEIRSVAAFERTTYGGLEAEVALAQCELAPD